LIKRAAYRFVAVYLGLFALASQIAGGLVLFPGFQFPAFGAIWPMRDITTWLGTHVFHVSTLDFRGVSADTPFHWVQLAWIAVVASIVAIATTVRLKADTTDAKAPDAKASGLPTVRLKADTTGTTANHPVRLKADTTDTRTAGSSVVSGFSRTDYWFRLFLRFALAAQMFYFGMAKVIPTQFPPPSLVTLLKPVGNLSPDDMLWTFMGASTAYQMFTGFAEVAAGLLLVVPKTAIVGALIALADMLQVFVLNMSYDVGLKQTSLHLLLIAVFLLAPDVKRLAGALVAGRPRTGRRWLWIQIAFGVYLLAMFTRLAMVSWENPGGPGAPKSALYGIWDVERMSVDGETRPPLSNDYDRRWRRIIFDTPDLMIFERLDDSFAHYGASIDPGAHSITLHKIQSRLWMSTFTFDRRGDDEMILDGHMDDHVIHAELQRVGLDVFRLTNGNFRWVRPPS
jgi:hypothetical protein